MQLTSGHVLHSPGRTGSFASRGHRQSRRVEGTGLPGALPGGREKVEPASWKVCRAPINMR
eukprot:scaffold82230_cov73-Phaeocystis_antarctica.AAC.3